MTQIYREKTETDGYKEITYQNSDTIRLNDHFKLDEKPVSKREEFTKTLYKGNNKAVKYLLEKTAEKGRFMGLSLESIVENLERNYSLTNAEAEKMINEGLDEGYLKRNSNRGTTIIFPTQKYMSSN